MMMTSPLMRLRHGVCSAVLAGVMLSGCAATTPDNDPYETANRRIFDFNIALDKAVARPAAEFYNKAVPEKARLGIHNALGNLNEPVVFSNQLLQGHAKKAGITAARFVMNSTLGIGGLIDTAQMAGLASQDTDFGITLGVWGVNEGPYLMLPLLGPAPPRDLAGTVADNFLDPVTYISFSGSLYYVGGRAVLKIVDVRARNIDTLDTIERNSLDYYATTRSLYLQYRAAKVRGEDQSGEAPPLPDDPAPQAKP